MVRLPRGIGEIAKDLGLSGCDHQLRISFLNVSAANADSIFTMLHGLWIPTSGSPKSGDLVVPDYGTYPHCIVTGCELSDQAAVATDVSPASPKGTDRHDYHFDLTFRQLRR